MVFVCKSSKVVHDNTCYKISVYLIPNTLKKHRTFKGVGVIEKHGDNCHREKTLFTTIACNCKTLLIEYYLKGTSFKLDIKYSHKQISNNTLFQSPSRHFFKLVNGVTWNFSKKLLRKFL